MSKTVIDKMNFADDQAMKQPFVEFINTLCTNSFSKNQYLGSSANGSNIKIVKNYKNYIGNNWKR